MAVEYSRHIRFMGDAYGAALPPRGLMSARHHVQLRRTHGFGADGVLLDLRPRGPVRP
jgi:hypothetical protein